MVTLTYTALPRSVIGNPRVAYPLLSSSGIHLDQLKSIANNRGANVLDRQVTMKLKDGYLNRGSSHGLERQGRS
jgi:hypothetical protein